MYTASQITATAIVPFPTIKDNTHGVHPYVLLYTPDNGATTTVNATPTSRFVGVTISETEFGAPNGALTVQLSGISTVRIAETATPAYGDLVYGGNNGECTTDSTSQVVVGRFLGGLGKQEGKTFATVLLCRSAAGRKSVDQGMVYTSAYDTTKAGDIILRDAVVPVFPPTVAPHQNFDTITNLSQAVGFSVM